MILAIRWLTQSLGHAYAVNNICNIMMIDSINVFALLFQLEIKLTNCILSCKLIYFIARMLWNLFYLCGMSI